MMRDENKTANENKTTEKEISMLHSDLLNLTSELKKCNRYLDIFFTANGTYEKAADVILLRRLEEAGKNSKLSSRNLFI